MRLILLSTNIAAGFTALVVTLRTFDLRDVMKSAKDARAP
jgi:hypothetical protein